MEIIGIKWQDDQKNEALVDFDIGELQRAGVRVPGDVSTIGNGPTREADQEWIDLGNTVALADPPAPPPTDDEIYDIAVKTQKVLNAIVLSINDGTLVPGANVTNAALKAIVKANM